MRILAIETNYNIHNQNQLAYKGKPSKIRPYPIKEGPVAKVGFWTVLTTVVSK